MNEHPKISQVISVHATNHSDKTHILRGMIWGGTPDRKNDR